MDGLYWKTLLKWMIWGFSPLFWKHPYHSTGSLLVSKKTQDLKQVELSDIPKGRLSLRCFYESVGDAHLEKGNAAWGVGEMMLVDGLMVPKERFQFLGTHVK